jgi:hypothetical protein
MDETLLGIASLNADFLDACCGYHNTGRLIAKGEFRQLSAIQKVVCRFLDKLRDKQNGEPSPPYGGRAERAWGAGRLLSGVRAAVRGRIAGFIGAPFAYS